jgi:hypothetical protein
MSRKEPHYERCVGCEEARPTWWLLRFSCDPEHLPPHAVPEGSFGGHIDGHLPVCGRCVPKCATCARPVPSDAIAARLTELETVPTLGVRWSVDPCDDPDHARPALESFPRDENLPLYGPPDPPRVVPGWSFLIAQLPRFGIGDHVTVEGIDGVGRVRYIRSTRIGGIAACVD